MLRAAYTVLRALASSAALPHAPPSPSRSPANVNILDGNASDLQAVCDAYEAKILELGGIELFLGGIGPDGHIAFSECGGSARALVGGQEDS